MAVYPEYPWKPWLFRKISRQYWENHENVASFLTWMAEQFGVVTLDDWYNVSRLYFMHRVAYTVQRTVPQCWRRHTATEIWKRRGSAQKLFSKSSMEKARDDSGKIRQQSSVNFAQDCQFYFWREAGGAHELSSSSACITNGRI